MRVRLSKRAARDLAEIADTLAGANPGAALSVGAAIAASQQLLSEHPRIGRLQRGRDLRKLVVPRYGCLIYYRVIERADLVAIVTVRHPSRARIASDG